MTFEMQGTQYGGWMLDLTKVPEGSTIISAGIGEDISFDLALINKKKCKIIAIDPTEKSHRFIERQSDLQNFSLIKKALTENDGDVIRLFRNRNPNHVSESVMPDHNAVNNFDSYLCETINLQSLFEKHSDVSVVKMDIEGSEYDLIENLSYISDTVKQFCIEFHHFCSCKTIEDTKSIIQKMNKLGFTDFVEKPNSPSLTEITFYRK